MSLQLTICKMKPTPLIPIHSAHGCAGHILRTAKGFRAFDSDDREIGSYPNADLDGGADGAGDSRGRIENPWQLPQFGHEAVRHSRRQRSLILLNKVPSFPPRVRDDGQNLKISKVNYEQQGRFRRRLSREAMHKLSGNAG